MTEQTFRVKHGGKTNRKTAKDNQWRGQIRTMVTSAELRVCVEADDYTHNNHGFLLIKLTGTFQRRGESGWGFFCGFWVFCGFDFFCGFFVCLVWFVCLFLNFSA